MENLVYNILTYSIIFIAVFFAVKRIIKKTYSEEETDCSNGCGGCTTKCELKNLAQTGRFNHQNIQTRK